MPRQTAQPPLQLGLDLRRTEPNPPSAEASTAFLLALADVLLGALGEEVEDNNDNGSTQTTGGSDESKDHG
jgi:hypothetical protein